MSYSSNTPQVQLLQAQIANTTLNSYEKSDLAYDALKEAARDRIDEEKAHHVAVQDSLKALDKKLDDIEVRVKGVEAKLEVD